MNRMHTKSALTAIMAAFVCGPIAMLIPTAEVFAQNSDSYCRAYDRDVSLRYSRGGAIGGAVRGGTGGAVVGGIVNGRKGARRGARVGATVGAVRRGAQRGVSYDVLYRDCMRGVIRY